MPSFILIHPTVWPQYTNVTDRQTGQRGQDNGPIAQGEPFYKRSTKKTYCADVVFHRQSLPGVLQAGETSPPCM